MAKRLGKRKRVRKKMTKLHGRIIDPDARPEVLPIHEGNKYVTAFMHKYDSWRSGESNDKISAATLLSDAHKELFGHGYNCPRFIAVARVSYALQKKGHEEAGILDKLPKGFKQNFQAAMDNNIDGFTSELRELLKLQVTQEEEGDESMAAKKKTGSKKVVKKTRGLTASSYLYEIFSVNNDKKLTDEQIQKLVLAKCPEAKCFQKISNIGVMRSRFNNGTGKYKVFSPPIQKFGGATKKAAGKKVAEKSTKKKLNGKKTSAKKKVHDKRK